MSKKRSILFKFDEYEKELGWDYPAQVQILKMLLQEAEHFGAGVLEDRLEDFYKAEKEMAEIVEGVRKAEEAVDQQDDGWYNEDEEKYHSSIDI